MEKNYNDSPLKIFFSYIMGQKKLFIIDMICAVLVAAIDLVFPYVSRASMYSLLPERLFGAFFAVMAAMVAAYILKSALYYVITVVGHKMGVLSSPTCAGIYSRTCRRSHAAFTTRTAPAS